ncbi:hypothetical protein I203_101889 [Kwoniella mangroviensis CBS 8507]|uniref:uncharacterized protein n=1 Tax=Kwoniella mangroviensis CBS 8507 TaxID=1296122 RepID=UPI00080D3B98|nr:uncharacterized protein I203_03085 [Kwoniella mangroviensis CBS 8507]OCF67391.1 hypothetical protein I203_03085 [Kwoniella mangroviensis CBS 8507]
MAEDRKLNVSSLKSKEDSVEIELEGVARNSYLVNSLFEGINSNSDDEENGDGDEDQYGEGDEKERGKEDRYEDENGDEDQRGVEDQEESEDETEDEDEEDEDEDEDYPVGFDLPDEQYHHQPLCNTVFASLEDAFSSDEEEDNFISIPKHIRDDDDGDDDDNDDDDDDDDDDEDFLPIPVSPWFVDLPTKSPPSENMSKPLRDKVKIDSQTNIDIDIQQNEEMDREQEETRRVYHDLYPPIYHEKRPIPLRDPWRLRSPVQKYHFTTIIQSVRLVQNENR